ncbi:MAG: Uma2 family endonuclease [bacterium]|nr:Uma2 family endonuclease [bacterium]
MPAREQEEHFTYSDYLSRDDDKRREIINGVIYDMAAAPGTKHQLIISELLRLLGNQLENSPCQVITAPFDVRLPRKNEKEENIENVVQPDLSVICDENKLDDNGCLGTPDMIIEVLSPSSYKRDKLEKFYLYENFGVKEYWIVSPDFKIVEIFILGPDGKYGRPGIYSESDVIELKALEGFKIDLSSVFR